MTPRTLAAGSCLALAALAMPQMRAQCIPTEPPRCNGYEHQPNACSASVLGCEVHILASNPGLLQCKRFNRPDPTPLERSTCRDVTALVYGAPARGCDWIKHLSQWVAGT